MWELSPSARWCALLTYPSVLREPLAGCGSSRQSARHTSTVFRWRKGRSCLDLAGRGWVSSEAAPPPPGHHSASASATPAPCEAAALWDSW